MRRTVSEVADAAGVSVRTLHHYDAIGLLKPAEIGENGYRYYGREELLRLQQILFYRELGLALAEIGPILDDPGFDRLNALRAHRAALEGRIARGRDLIRTIDRTIESLEKDEEMEDCDLYAGISPETRARWESEAERFWGAEAVRAAQEKARSFSKERVAGIKREMEEIRADFTRLFRERADPGSDAVQAVTARHHAWVSNSWTPDAGSFRGLGRYYVEHPEFRGTYEDELPGCPEFIAEAMSIYADRSL
ncbi:MerR family transcriptional regulator [Sphingosinicella sp. LHD-64]|uniref:MerR family transcriptional regulator n=1 Tax=Sphingosinicella sp. LHD-64 TaxID=3072139 RepID=UPI00280EBA3F|nr:MerR family transcriptional regulator [Sphingosinicella sp. LHD-64]MDQ8755450.1 MerR family transcriptional regulator [Sphingosinicella sp. LHD-64]